LSLDTDGRIIIVVSVNRQKLIQRIQSLSEEELERVGPFLEADLDVLAEMDDEDLDDMQRSIDRGLESARTEPLVDHDDLMREMRATIARRRPTQ
jgi:hypothetical protein